MTRRTLMIVCAAASSKLAWGDPPGAVLALLKSAAEALADQDPPAFLELFDRAMPGYAQLRAAIEALLAPSGVASTVEIVEDEGTDQARDMEIDWLLQAGRDRPRRAVLKCRVERRGRGWKFVKLEPVSFFAGT